MCVSRMGEVGQMSFFLLGTVEEEDEEYSRSLLSCPACQCRLTGEESLGRCVRKPGEAPWAGHGESVCVCLCVDMGSD